MTTYIVFRNRPKRHEETLREYYEATVYGSVDSANPPKAILAGVEQFHVQQWMIDVVSLKHASMFQKDYINKTGWWKPKPAKKGGK